MKHPSRSELPRYIGIAPAIAKGTLPRRLHCYAENARAALRLMARFGVTVAKRAVRPMPPIPPIVDNRRAPGA